MAEILLPVGRMIGGSLYKPQPKLDNFGKPKLGTDGKPVTGYNFGVAIPKAGEQHWAQTQWGAQIRAVGVAASPGICDTPSFAWKITDGDSQIPNKKNRRPCDQVGYQRHWVLWFSQTWAPKLCNANGTQELTTPDTVMPGDFVQVFCSVKSNAPSPTPGVYLNPLAVAHIGYHPEGRIEVISVDTAAVGFGQAVPANVMSSPPGMTAPAGGMMPPNVSYGGAPAAGPAPGYQSPPAPTGTATAAYPSNPPPNPAFLAVPGMPPAPPPSAPPARTMLPAANGASYEVMRSMGWTDAQLVAHGMMAA